MLERGAYEYAVIRVMPNAERGEFVNAGVVVICRATRFLASRIALDRARLAAIAPGLSSEHIDDIERQLGVIPRICAGDLGAGQIAALTLAQRWHWLTAPANTVVQPGPVHTGFTTNPAATLDRLFGRMVLGTRE